MFYFSSARICENGEELFILDCQKGKGENSLHFYYVKMEAKCQGNEVDYSRLKLDEANKKVNINGEEIEFYIDDDSKRLCRYLKYIL